MPLKQEGWLEVHVKGSHYTFKHPDKPGIVTVLHPRKDIPLLTVRSMYRQAGWQWT